MQMISLKKKRGHSNITREDAIEVKSLLLFHLKVVNIESKLIRVKDDERHVCASLTHSISEKEKLRFIGRIWKTDSPQIVWMLVEEQLNKVSQLEMKSSREWQQVT